MGFSPSKKPQKTKQKTNKPNFLRKPLYFITFYVLLKAHNSVLNTSVFCKSLIIHSTMYLSAVWKVILLFWRKFSLNINHHLNLN